LKAREGASPPWVQIPPLPLPPLRRIEYNTVRPHEARTWNRPIEVLLGVPSRAVMDVVGWSQASMTTRHQHMTSELARSIAHQVGELFWADDPGD
jgi:integrase